MRLALRLDLFGNWTLAFSANAKRAASTSTPTRSGEREVVARPIAVTTTSAPRPRQNARKDLGVEGIDCRSDRVGRAPAGLLTQALACAAREQQRGDARADNGETGDHLLHSESPPLEGLPPAPLVADEVSLRCRALQPGVRTAEALPAPSVPAITSLACRFCPSTPQKPHQCHSSVAQAQDAGGRYATLRAICHSCHTLRPFVSVGSWLELGALRGRRGPDDRSGSP